MDGDQRSLLATLATLFITALVTLSFAQSTSTSTAPTTVPNAAAQLVQVFNMSSAGGKAKGTQESKIEERQAQT